MFADQPRGNKLGLQKSHTAGALVDGLAAMFVGLPPTAFSGMDIACRPLDGLDGGKN
jgi:hypothetical protein